MSDVTVVVPSIAPRSALLDRALSSIKEQIWQPVAVIVEYDHDRQGAAITRQRGLERVKTPYVAFLDDDDEFLSCHLQALRAAFWETSADMVFSWYEVVGGTDPRPDEFGLEWDAANPRQTTITTMVRTDLAREVGGFVDPEDTALTSPDRHYAGEDWRFTKRINEAGVIYHLPRVTWRWHHHSANTSGLPHR